MGDPKDDRRDANGRRMVSGLLLWLAASGILGLSLVVFLLFRPLGEAAKLLIAGTVGGVVAVLLAFIVRHTLLRPVESFLSDSATALLVEKVATAVTDRAGGRGDLAVYARWNDVPWNEILHDVEELEIIVSYMDTWLNTATDSVIDIFRRGGRVRIYLPRPGSEAARRVGERFPEYEPSIVAHKIEHTAKKLTLLWKRAGNPSGRLEICLTDVFVLHCLMRLDHQRLILSPFDHFRRGQIEGPAILLRADAYPYVATWANKEFDGFAEKSTLQP